jgi:ABC-type glycerol-3-phosphate transport system substrate-binding protein
MAALAPVVLSACTALPGPFRPATPTPSQPREVRIAYPNLEAFQFLSTRLNNLANHVSKDRYISVTTTPIDLAVNGKLPNDADVPARYAAALNALKGAPAPDLVMTDVITFPELGKGAALKVLGDVLRTEAWFKADDFLGNALVAGQYRGKQIAIPLDASIESLLYNEAAFKQQGFPPPAPGSTWDQVVATAKTLTKPEAGSWGFLVGADMPSFLTMGWQRGAQIVNDDATKIDLTEPGTLAGLDFLAALSAAQKVSPPLDPQLLPDTLNPIASTVQETLTRLRG